jgi:selenocysteine-specific elongation factor
MQMFRKPVSNIRQGDRVGICVAGLDANTIERGLAAKPRSMKATDFVIAVVKRVSYFQQEVKSKSKIHISMGH